METYANTVFFASEKISFGKLHEIMSDYNKRFPENQDEEKLTGVIVYKQSSFKQPYTEMQRSYRVSNANRCFQGEKISNALVGDCLDGVDLGVRLDRYRWEVDYCYMD